MKRVERKAAGGDATAQYYLAIAYSLGLSVETNEARAYCWTKLAAQQGMPRAERRLGDMLQRGIGTATNLIEASEWYRVAAEHGDAKAQNNLGWFYQKGLGVNRDPKEALGWYLKAAEQGEHLAQKNLAWIYATGAYGTRTGFGQGAEAQVRSGGFPPDHEQAEMWMLKAVDLTTAQGQFEFGTLLTGEFNGEGHRDKSKLSLAADYLRKAAEQGHARAQYCLAYMYHTGDLGDNQRSNCIPWFLKSAAQGNDEAQAKLGELSRYYPKSELLKSISPVESLLKSAGNGNLDAQFELAMRYQVGDGVPKAPAEAFKWMQRAAQNEARSSVVSKARYRLGAMYESGYGVPSDALKARELYRRAVYAEFTDPSASFRVAQMWEKGQDVPQNDEEAVERYFDAILGAGGEFRSEAIESLLRLYADGRGVLRSKQRLVTGNDPRSKLSNVPELVEYMNGLVNTPRAQLYVGQIYHQGKIVDPDPVEAAAWLQLAARQGVEEAQRLLKEIEEQLSSGEQELVNKRAAGLEARNRSADRVADRRP